MITREALCKKIEAVYPEAGVCGVDFDVEYDSEVQAWAVALHHGNRQLKTYIEQDEASSCLEGKKCVPLTLQVAQLKRNLEKYVHEDHAL